MHTRMHSSIHVYTELCALQGEGGERLKKADIGVLHDKHRPAAVPAAAWAMLGGGGQEAVPDDAEDNGNGGASSNAVHPAVPVSYLPPARNQRYEHDGSTAGPDGNARGDVSMSSDAWQWHDVKAKKDSSQAAFTGDLNRILAQADVLLEVLDARDPDGCRLVWFRIESFSRLLTGRAHDASWLG